MFLPQDCGFTLNPSPLYPRQAEENTLREQELLQTEQFAKYSDTAQQWGSAGEM